MRNKRSMHIFIEKFGIIVVFLSVDGIFVIMEIYIYIYIYIYILNPFPLYLTTAHMKNVFDISRRPQVFFSGSKKSDARSNGRSLNGSSARDPLTTTGLLSLSLAITCRPPSFLSIT